MSKYVKRSYETISDDGFLERVKEHVKISLKTCPFCGGKSKVLHHDNPGFFELDSDDAVNVVCTKCGAMSAVCGSLEETVEKWNARV